MGNPLQHDWGGIDLVVNKLRIGAASAGATGTEMTGAEITVLDSVTAGTVAASKAVVVDANKDASEFRKLGATQFIADSGTKTATATGGAATLAKTSGKITSEALTTAAGADYVLTLTNSAIAAADLVFASVDNGTNTTEGLAINRVTPGAGSVVIRVRNTHASAALNGTVVISFWVLKNS